MLFNIQVRITEALVSVTTVVREERSFVIPVIALNYLLLFVTTTRLLIIGKTIGWTNAKFNMSNNKF